MRKVINACVFGVASAAVLRETQESLDTDTVDLKSVASAQVVSTLEAFSGALLDPAAGAADGEANNVGHALNAISSQMNLDAAVKVFGESKVPEDVSHLVQKVAKGDTEANQGFASQFSEESLAKARKALNDLIEKAWIELDDKIFKCKGFEDMNRENYGQVTRDIMRLIEQINDLERIEAESIAGIAEKEQQILDVEALLAKETGLYNTEHAANKAELTIRQNDLDVFQFILVFTKCADATSLAQVCELRSGRKTLLFKDRDAAVKYKKMLTPTSKRTIDNLLRSMEGETSFLQLSNGTTPPPTQEPVPVKGEDGGGCVGSTGAAAMGSEDDCLKGCSPEPPDCGLLHDKLSLMWGEFKDKVDELTMIMMKNEFEWYQLKMNLNNQLSLLAKSKARFNQLLAEARSNMAADRTELKEKGKQKAKLDKQYFAYMAACKKRIEWIMYQDMCAIKVVRNAVLENSTVCPSAKIVDCDMDAWVPHQCSVSCDDSCDPNLPFKCGGWQNMVRATVVPNDDCGIKCPISEKMKRCGQFKCPIDCAMSQWSGWSKCTAECEGGLQSHTRYIRVKPKNGGEQCNTVEESRPCNTMSCDRDCTLQEWTPFTPCSVACGGGFQERFRHVLIPIRGEGKCAKDSSSMRYEEQTCNENKCNGDEICIANQDLVVAVDGSGSLQEGGFGRLKKYVETLLGRYQTEYYGKSTVKIGIVLFGNGVIMPDGKTVSPAISAQPLSSDLPAVLTSVKDLPFKKGFTNMAQAFSMAEDMFIKGSRKGSQSAVMVITDGKPSFSFMTNEMVEQLDDKGIMRYFVVISEESGDSDLMRQMKDWASQPWETNVVHIQGLELLESDYELFSMKALTKFCPMAYSPQLGAYEAEVYGYQHVKDAGYCGEQGKQISWDKKNGADECAALATGAECSTFILGTMFLRGQCWCGTIAVTKADYEGWMSPEGKTKPACPAGEWFSSMLFDFYAMNTFNKPGEDF